MDKVVTRFAPSPTGYLHVGGARTGLFNWLYARHHQSTFVLRIEDTDRSRSTDEAIQQVIDSLTWLGLDWDRFARQTDRLEQHVEAADELLRNGHAYKSEGAVWFRAPAEGVTTVQDLLLGPVEFQHRELKDMVILRSDGTPTYNFACVVDDADMGITHVIRGDEHLNNTPKQLLIYRALDLEAPSFAHIPLILGPDKAKLSKRHGAVSVLEYRRRGFVPEALVNFLARLGWAYGDQEVFSQEELIELFDLPGIGKSAAVFDESKLLWLNHEWLNRYDLGRLAEELARWIVTAGVATREQVDTLSPERLRAAAAKLRERGRTLVQMAEMAHFMFPGELPVPEDARELFTEDVCHALARIADAVESLGDPAPAELETEVHRVLHELGLPLKKVAQPMRVLVTGSRVGPSLFEVLYLAGPASVAQRLRSAAKWAR
ncbi:MAG: glutamate--tRNA ligase [Candidatus Bipolaricaulota bacterium]